MGYTVSALHLLLWCKLPAGRQWSVPQYSKCCTLGVSYSDSSFWICPLGPQKWARTREVVNITELVYEVSTVATTAEGDPQYHFYKVTGKQNISAFNHRWLWHRISPDTDILQGYFCVRESVIDMTYRVDKKLYVCSDCSVDMLHMKWKEQIKAEWRGPKLYKLTTRGHHAQIVNRNIWAWDIIYVWGWWNIECSIYFHFLKLYVFSQN